MWKRALPRLSLQLLSRQAGQRGTATQAAGKENPLIDILSEQLRQIRVAGTFKNEIVITSPQSASVGELLPYLTDRM